MKYITLILCITPILIYALTSYLSTCKLCSNHSAVIDRTCCDCVVKEIEEQK
jgi:hypothetical protein